MPTVLAMLSTAKIGTRHDRKYVVIVTHETR
jgi:hypothetical protein